MQDGAAFERPVLLCALRLRTNLLCALRLRANRAHPDSNGEQKFRKLPFYPVKLWALDKTRPIANSKAGSQSIWILLGRNSFKDKGLRGSFVNLKLRSIL